MGRRILQCLLSLALTTSWAAAAVLRVGSGELRLNGQAVVADRLEVEAGARLSGSGEIRAETVIAGTVTPGGAAGQASELRFGAGVTFAGGEFECEALAHEELDRLIVSGNVVGFGTVRIAKEPGAVPVGQIVIAGGPHSDYDALVASPGSEWQLGRTNHLDLTLTDLVGDTDGDGMADWWELEYFFDRVAGGAGDDPDGDRFINLHECRAGTNPRDFASKLVAWPIQRSAVSDIVRWQSVAGKRYAIEMRTNLLTGSSQRLQGGIVATGTETGWTNSNVASDTRFYRIVVE